MIGAQLLNCLTNLLSIEASFNRLENVNTRLLCLSDLFERRGYTSGAIMIHHEIVSQPIQPGNKRHSAWLVAIDCFPCLQKHLLGQIFSLARRSGAVVNVPEDAIEIVLVKNSEGGTIALHRANDEPILV